MGVKVRAVHAGELGLSAYDDAAAAAHTGAVHHDGVERDDGLDAVGAGDVGQEFHHNIGADSDDPVKLGLALSDIGVDLLLEVLGGEALFSVAAVVRADDELVGGRFQLLLQNDDVRAAETGDEGHLNAQLVHLLGNGVGNGAAHAAADHADLLQAVHLGGLAQRTHKVGDIVSLLHGVEHSCGASGSLYHNGDSAFFPVPAGDGDGDALALFIQTEDHELTRLGVTRHQRGLDLEEADGFCLVQESFAYYLIHQNTSIL